MKKILFVLLTNMMFAQSVPDPIAVSIPSPPTKQQIETTTDDEVLKESLLPFIKNEKYGIGIINYRATDDYASTGATFMIYNSSKKTIKYIWFTVAGENAVGDLVKTGGVYYKTLKGIGPTGSYKFGQWSFDYVWLTDIVEYIKLSTIKIQYMDGTFKTIKYNDNLYIGDKAYEAAMLALNNISIKESGLENKKNYPIVTEDDATVFAEVEQSAEYPGRIGALRKTFGENFDTSEMIPETAKAKTELTFIIEKDGSISDIKANGNNDEFNKEAIRTMKKVRPIWSPALINSVKVRSIYKIKF